MLQRFCWSRSARWRWRLWLAPRLTATTADAGALHEYLAPRGRPTSLRLADGSRVVLAAESRLRVRRDFGQPGVGRDVELEGQAYFDVVHDAPRPFLVRTAGSVTEDIGTRFAVRAYPAESGAEVFLDDGVVAVRAARSGSLGAERHVLMPGQLIRIDHMGNFQALKRADPSRYLAWTKGDFAFDGTPFRQVAADVERWFDLDIRLADSALGGRRISGEVAAESADAVLGYLALALHARYERHGRTVTFEPR